MIDSDVAGHYRRPGLVARIRAELEDAGYDPDDVDASALAGVDEFHLGGRMATNALIASIPLTPASLVLDVGCGIGGAARTMVLATGSTVTGVDLTPEFVDAAVELTSMLGLADRASFRLGSALELPFDDAAFDVVTMIHVGMNIADKWALFEELARVLRPEGTLAVYDIVRMSGGELTYPVPWAGDARMSSLATPSAYVDAMTAAGVVVGEPVNRIGLVRRAIAAVRSHPPPLNLSHLMGDGWATMFGNLTAALDADVVAPIEITARRLS